MGQVFTSLMVPNVPPHAGTRGTQIGLEGS